MRTSALGRETYLPIEEGFEAELLHEADLTVLNLLGVPNGCRGWLSTHSNQSQLCLIARRVVTSVDGGLSCVALVGKTWRIGNLRRAAQNWIGDWVRSASDRIAVSFSFRLGEELEGGHR